MKAELYQNAHAEQEANERGSDFMNSHDVMKDLGETYGASRVASVHFHSDSNAQQRTRNAGVDAMASGNNIYFGKGTYPANTPASRGLLAHEMTHVMQQQQGNVPRGAQQGGLLDWFQNLFRKNSQPTAEQTVEEPVDENAGPGWKDAQLANAETDESVVVKDPVPDAFKDMLEDSDIREGFWQNPVFETHAFFPRKGIDGQDVLHIHSFIGLRFTTMMKDGKNGLNRYARKRMQIGLGMKGPADNGGMQTDISTETPIRPEKVKAVWDRIQSKGKDCYNLLTYNCNHFAKEMAETAGARLPAQLHDSVLGPAGAYTNIGKAATKYAGKQALDDTRFFQGGSQEYGQMARKQDFMTSYVSEAQSAARYDLCPFSVHTKLRDNVRDLGDLTKSFAPYYNSEIEFTETKLRDFNKLANDIREGVKTVVATPTFISHPRVNIATLKLSAMVDALVAERCPTEERKADQWTMSEMVSNLAKQNQNEKDANYVAKKFGKNPDDAQTANINKLLFKYSSSTESFDKVLSAQCGLSHLEKENDVAQFRLAFQNAQNLLHGDLRQYLVTYTSAQPDLSPQQIAAGFTKRLLTGLYGASSNPSSRGGLLRANFLINQGGVIPTLSPDALQSRSDEETARDEVVENFCKSLADIVGEIQEAARGTEATATES